MTLGGGDVVEGPPSSQISPLALDHRPSRLPPHYHQGEAIILFMCAAILATPTFIDWAGDAVFFNLVKKPAIPPTTKVNFSSWSVKVVFSGLPTERRDDSVGTTQIQNKKNALTSPSPVNSNGVGDITVSGAVMPQHATGCKKESQEGASDGNNIPDENVEARGANDCADKKGLCKSKLLLVAPPAQTPDQNDNVDRVAPQPLTDRNNKLSLENVAGKHDFRISQNSSVVDNAIRGGDESNCAKIFDVSKTKLLQVAAQHITAKESDQNADDHQFLANEESVKLDSLVSVKKGNQIIKSNSEERKTASQSIVKDQTPTFNHWASSFVFSGLFKRGESVTRKNDPRIEQALFLDGVKMGGDESYGVKESLGKTKLLLVAAQQAVTKSDQRNDLQQVHSKEDPTSVPRHRTNVVQKMQEGATSECDCPNEKALAVDDVAADEYESNGLKKDGSSKNRFLQVAAQHIAAAPNEDDDEHQVSVKEERPSMDLIVPTVRGKLCKTSASEEQEVESRAIAEKQTPSSYLDWASNIVFSGLLEKREVEQQIAKQTTLSFNDWAQGAVFKDLLNKVHVQQKQDASIPLLREQNSIINRIHDTTSSHKLNVEGAKESPAMIKQIDSRTFVDVGNKSDDPSTQSKQTALCIKSRPSEESHNVQKCGFRAESPEVDKGDVSAKPLCNGSVSFDRWAAGVVFSGLTPKSGVGTIDHPQRYWTSPKLKTNSETILPFNDWAMSVVFNGMSDKTKKSDSGQKADTVINGMNNSVKKFGSDRITDGIDESMRSEKSVDFADSVTGGSQMIRKSSSIRNAKNDDIGDSLRSEKSVEFAAVVLDGINDKMAKPYSSFKSEKSVNFDQIFCQAEAKASKGVTFRGRDSFIQQKSYLWKSGNTEASMDFEALLGGDRPNVVGDEAAAVDYEDSNSSLPPQLSATADSKPSPSSTSNLKMGKSFGDIDFDYEDSNSSLPPQLSATADSKPSSSETANLKMEKSFGDLDFNYEESNSTLPSQLASMADSSPAKPDIDAMGKSIGNIVFNFNESNSSLPPKRMNDFNIIRHNEINTAPRETQRQDQDTDKQRLMSHHSNTFFPEREDKSSLNLVEEQAREPVHRSEETNINRTQSDRFLGTAYLNGHDSDGNQPKRNVPLNKETENGCRNAAEEKRRRNHPPRHYTIPVITTASIMKRRIDDRVGLVFSSKSQKIILASMTPNSPFRHTDLAINDELLVINGHRVKYPKKAAEFIRKSHGKLTLSAFHGTRPEESELVMTRLSRSDYDDIRFFTNNGMVHIIRAGGRFSKSGKIQMGDICLTINGQPVHEAARASKLIWEAAEVDKRSLRRTGSNHTEASDYDFNHDDGLVILLVFSLAKLRRRLIKNISTDLPLIWNDQYNECAIKLPSGNARRLLCIHNDGNCEEILEPLGEIDPKVLNYIDEAFVSKFYSQFQDSMRDLHEAMLACHHEE